ncbi:L,D-transpeptidase family protein [uncultured Methylobacterium sp.]|uniref:L,D-transpeptidase family protein n=1 Tax=uncultured Methylobacterium sp. TaxID=157278 RepID=UPI0035CC32E5
MAVRPFAAARLIAPIIGLGLSLGACQDGGLIGGASTRHLTPIPVQTMSLMQTKGMSQGDPIVIRAYKKEAEMEVWKRGASGQYALLKTFPICRWSGQLGPKRKQGDRQAPEGFYTITPGQMNPSSAYFLSFDTGYPNAYDRANGGTGNYLMVHGTCSSAGCFAMTDASMGEIYAIAREAFAGGQRAFQFQSYPFRMTAQNMAKYRNDPNAPFWRNIKEGSDYFEALHDEPKVGLCGTKYVFGGSDAAAGACTPKVEPLVAEKRAHDNREIADLVAKGTPATRLVYEDGGGNPVFQAQQTSTAFASLSGTETELPYAAKEYGRHHLGDVSRPESLAAGPREVEVDAKGRPVMLAAAEAPTPVKAAAPAAAKPSKAAVKPAARTLMAKQPDAGDEPSRAVVKEGPAAKPERISVADADGDPSAYQRLLSKVFNKETLPATPAADAAVAEPVNAAAAHPVKIAHAAPRPASKETAPERTTKADKVDKAP